MDRLALQPRTKWQETVESQGLQYHTIDGSVYWDESACYRFAVSEVDLLEDATEEVQRLCLAAVDHVIRKDLFDLLQIPRNLVPLVVRSWDRREPSMYGRFDFAYDGSRTPKLLEYNADTPTALLEASVIQWFWLKDVFPDADQFNSIHEKLIDFWQGWRAPLPVYFTCVDESTEDVGNVEYLMDTAIQCGLDARHLFIGEIGWDRLRREFVDLEEAAIGSLFKLYPWEWMAREDFGPHLLESRTAFLEPPWKMILSNKGILPILWDLFEGHPNLLPASFSGDRFKGDFVKKPLLSREGANISITRGDTIYENPGTYGDEGWIWQAFEPLRRFDGNHAVVGSWIIGGQAAGIGIREDTGPITTNASRFVPHFFEEE